MQFSVYHARSTPKSADLKFPYVALYQDNWDDFGWKCRFTATLHLSKSNSVDLGALRIASNSRSFRVSNLPAIIEKFPPKTASLGESIAYYRKIRDLVPPRVRREYLTAVRDIVAKSERRDRITDTDLWEKCFMREASSRHAHKRGAYYLGGTPEEVDPPSFIFSMTLPEAAGPHVIDLEPFHVTPTRAFPIGLDY